MMRSARSRWASSVLLAISLVLAGGLAWVLNERDHPTREHTIQGSYAFDVTDKFQLAGYADDVFVGTVEAVESVDDSRGAPRTIFQVTVEEVVKGDMTGEVLVRQLGGVVGEDTWHLENQSLLQVKGRYLLVTTRSVNSDRVNVLVAGPISSEMITSGDDQRMVVERWQDAVTHQRTPDAFSHE